MKKTLLVGVLLLSQATVVHAAGIRLRWDNCAGGNGALTRTFACNSNTAPSHALVASVVAPAGIGSWNSFEAEYIFRFNGPQPAWWQLRNQTNQANQCRNGSLSANAIGAGLTGCTDLYQGNGAGGIGTFQNGLNIPASEEGGPAPHRARLLLVFAVQPGSELPLSEGVEYFAARVVINNARTVNTPCTGCGVAACIELVGIRIGQPAGAPNGNPEIRNGSPFWDNVAGWQTSQGDLSLCFDSPSPTHRDTWGGVKSLYR